MGQNKEELKRLLAFIDTLVKQPGNDEFVAGLRALVYKGKTSEKEDLEDIRRILKIRGTQSVNYSFVDDELTRNQLIMDNIRMEDALLDNSLSIEDKWYEFCTYAHFQVENLLNLYFAQYFDSFNDVLTYIEKNTSYKGNNAFQRQPNQKSVEHIFISYKSDAFCTEFFPYVPNLPDYTSYNLKLIRDVRNEYSHRSAITKTNPKSAIKIAFEKTNFSSIRRSLIILSNVIAQKLAPANYKGIIKNILPSAVVIEFNGASVVLDNHLYSKYKGKFTLNASVEVVARRNNILDIVI